MDKSEAGKIGHSKAKEKIQNHIDNMIKKAKEKYLENQKNCPNCESLISYKDRRKTFCSSSCSAQYNNKRRKLKNKIKECKFCKSHWNVDYKNRNNQYCTKCIENGNHIKRAESIEDCKHDCTRRNFLLRTREYKCSKCSRKTWNGDKIPLQMHHIDGDPTNNEENNLCLICPNCHVQTESWGGKNKGNGRSWRYKK